MRGQVQWRVLLTQVLVVVGLLGVLSAGKKTRGTPKEPSRARQSTPLVVQSSSKRHDFLVLEAPERYDAAFLREWWHMARRLWHNMPDAQPKDAREFLARDTERPWRARQLVAHRTPVACGALDLQLKPVQLLHDGGKNCVLRLRDAKSARSFVLKTSHNPVHFAAELTFSQFVPEACPYFVPAVCHRHDEHRDVDAMVREAALHGSSADSSSSTSSSPRGRRSARGGDPTGSILYEFVPGGMTSFEYARRKHRTYADLQRLTAQLLLAVEVMHYLGFVHGDLKPDNVMVDDRGTLRVIDYGFTTRLPHCRRHQGTRETMAPELYELVPGAVHEAVDWWAVAMTVAIWFGQLYGVACVPLCLHKRPHVHYEAGVIPEAFPPSLRALLFHFLSLDPDTRAFNVPRLLRYLRGHEFFEGVNWDELYGGRFEYAKEA